MAQAVWRHPKPYTYTYLYVLHTYLHIYIYIYIYIYTYIHTYIHTFTQMIWMHADDMDAASIHHLFGDTNAIKSVASKAIHTHTYIHTYIHADDMDASSIDHLFGDTNAIKSVASLYIEPQIRTRDRAISNGPIT